MLGKHKFTVGQRVRPSRYGVERLIFNGTYRGQKRAEWSGRIISVDRFNSPIVKWDVIKTPAGYHPDFIEPDRRRRRP